MDIPEQSLKKIEGNNKEREKVRKKLEAEPERSGNVISFFLFLSPMPTFIKIFKAKSVEAFMPDPYVTTTLNCALWVFYGFPFIHPDSLLVLSINAVGFGMEVIYVTIFLIYSDGAKRKKIFIALLIEATFFGIIVAITLAVLHGTKQRSLLVGTICIIFNIVMYFSPLTLMKQVIKTKSVKYMPFYLSLANFANGGIWFTYALLKLDIYVLKNYQIGPTFVTIWKAKSVQNFKPDPYLATIFNCGMWLLYGLPFVHPDSTLVLTINGIGLVIEGIFIIVFIICSDGPKRKKIFVVLLIEFIIWAIICVITMVVLHGTKARSLLVGIVCIVLNVIMYASPLTVMKQVIKTRSVKYMPFPLSLANFVNGLIWTAYALLKFDLFILIPNALGSISGAVQLILYGAFYRTTNWDEGATKGTSNIELSSSNV
ncbi:hypothetical protein M9H77_04697 [Catharanthus roseus]|uniref:Uncharacterized protein n=1 Tax=Catharanthus roseus TaxID=4058 RepID=A0ACC0CF00_CATRO|nr:hypothetical protein M9H77_04697 [Catharanthus roseus]